MLADHVAFANRLNWNLIGHVLCLAQNPSEGFCGPAGRIFFHVMVRFDYFGIEISAKNLPSSVRQSKKRVHAHAEIGCKYNWHGFGSFFNRAPLFRGVPSCSNNERSPML